MRYGLYPASFNNGSLLLAQVASVAVQSGKSIFVVRPGGTLDPGANVLSIARPIAAIMTHDLATVLPTVSLTAGYDCSAASRLNFQHRATAGAFVAAASTDHVMQSIANGFLSVSEISAASESDDPAQCLLEFVALSADGTNPITDDDDVAISAQPAPAYNSVFYHGPAYLGSNQLDGLMSTRVRPGLVYAARIPDGGVFPARAASSIVARQPAIEMQFLNLKHIKNRITEMIHSLLAETVAVYFQRGTTAAGGRIAKATTSHAVISAAAGSWGADNVTVQDTDDATFTATIMPTGTLSFSVASAIPS